MEITGLFTTKQTAVTPPLVLYAAEEVSTEMHPTVRVRALTVEVSNRPTITVSS